MLLHKRLKVTRLSILVLSLFVLLGTLVVLSRWQTPTEATTRTTLSSYSKVKGAHHSKGTHQVHGSSSRTNHTIKSNSPTVISSSTSTNNPAAPGQSAAPTNTPVTSSPYPWHSNITTTVFWAGEDASADNGYITNRSSAWMDDWLGAFGGVDAQHNRCGYNPCGFTPNENTFYFALPFSDYTDNGPKSNLSMVPWYSGPLKDGDSLLKNHWIEINHNGKLAYAQWEDVGPFGENDSQYVFGSQPPKQKVGLDVSPAASDYLGTGDQAVTSWRFINQAQVPSGPWTARITSSLPKW